VTGAHPYARRIIGIMMRPTTMIMINTATHTNMNTLLECRQITLILCGCPHLWPYQSQDTGGTNRSGSSLTSSTAFLSICARVCMTAWRLPLILFNASSPARNHSRCLNAFSLFPWPFRPLRIPSAAQATEAKNPFSKCELSHCPLLRQSPDKGENHE